MACIRRILPLALGIALAGCPSAFANRTFNSSDIEGQGSEVIFCDLDGDQLKDAVLVDGRNLSIFYQDAKQGFTRKPQLQYRLEDRPSIVWSARLGSSAESLLVMTSEGVTELCFTNRTNSPARQQILSQQTILPDKLDQAKVSFFPLSAATGTDWPLLLVPVAGGIQVWQHRDAWHQTQFIEQAVDAHLWASVANPGYTRSFGLSMSLSDANGDGRDDLMVMRNISGGMQVYAFYAQSADGLFAVQPALTYTNRANWHSKLSWVDMNRDGKVDLIKSTVLDEASFVPGLRSGKVMVAAYLADAQGKIPAEPQQVFRKNDWSSAIPVADIDGDGFVDLVLGYIPISTREGFRKMITAKELDYSLKIHFFRPGSGFSKDPDCHCDVVVHLDREFLLTFDHRIDLEQIINFNGDFNGDGKKDLLVRDRSDEISAYFFVSREKGFSSKADLRFSCPEPIEGCEVRDLNGDGVSDLIVKLQKRNVFRIFTSQSK